ncbi:hypothetical protein MNBD_NITROSPINAE05-522, partial [hydrothermal vent metagenome]
MSSMTFVFSHFDKPCVTVTGDKNSIPVTCKDGEVNVMTAF